MDEVLNILQTFPHLVPSLDFKLWNGIILVEEEEVSVSISTPHYPSLEELSFVCPIPVAKHIKQQLQSFKVINDNNGLLQLLEYLSSADSTVVPENSRNNNVKKDNSLFINMDIYFYNQVLNELKQLKSHSIVACSGDLSEVTLKTTDSRGMDHKLVLGFSPTKKLSVLDVDLPQVALSDLCQATTIRDMFGVFQNLVDSFRDFWNEYDTLIKNTWLLDPDHPSFKDNHCRIVIDDNVSVLVTLNPLDVNNCPDIKFLGPENAIIPFINAMEKKLKEEGWNEEISVLENLLSLLNLTEFPQPDLDSSFIPQQDECSICFMVRLHDQTLPTKVCNNLKCNSYFHVSCLAQWFQAVPTNETSFNLISGECPTCGERILCPVRIG